MMRCKSFSFAIACALLGACGGPLIKSNTEPTAAGVVYYLPKQLVKIEITRSAVPNDLTEKMAKAKDAARTLAAAQEEKQKQADMLSDAATNAVNDRAKAELELQAGMLAAQATSMQKPVVEAQNKITQMQAQLRLLTDSGLLQPPFQDRIVISKLDPVADIDQRYVAQLQPRVSRSDDLTLTTNSAGLLSNSKVTSTDQTADVIVAAVNSLGGLAQLANLKQNSALQLSQYVVADPPKCRPKAFSFQRILDPTSQDELGQLNALLARQCAPLVFSLNGDPQRVKLTPEEQLVCNPLKCVLSKGNPPQCEKVEKFSSIPLACKPTKQTIRDGNGNGIWYRRQLPYVLAVSDNKGLEQSIMLELPNQAPAELLPLDGVALSQAVHEVKLVNGMLLEHHQVKPSSALAIAKTPGLIAKAIIDIPAQLLTLRIENTKAQTALSVERLKLLKQIAELEAELAKQAAAARAKGLDQ